MVLNIVRKRFLYLIRTRPHWLHSDAWKVFFRSYYLFVNMATKTYLPTGRQSVADPGFPIVGGRGWGVATHWGVPTLDAGAFRQKRMQKRNDWVLLGGGPGSTNGSATEYFLHRGWTMQNSILVLLSHVFLYRGRVPTSLFNISIAVFRITRLIGWILIGSIIDTIIPVWS